MKTRHATWWLALISALLLMGGAGCDNKKKNGDPDGGVDAGPDAAQLDGSTDPDADTDASTTPAPERSCETEFRYTPTGTVTTVQVAGEWDWSTPEDLLPDGQGSYVLHKTLAPGLHAYKLVVDGSWIFDPSHAYRKYEGGVENSGMRVPDCTVPLLELDVFDAANGDATARVRFLRANGGAAMDPAARRVVLVQDFNETEPIYAYTDHAFEVSLSGLTSGKYTLRFEASDLDGHAALPVQIPFWVESDAFDWRDPVLYMVMVDRFRDGDPSNNAAPSSGAEPTADWQGGDLAGVTAAINEGYFDDLGVRALWLSPFIRNPEVSYAEHGHGVTGYHGYWPIRAREVDPRFGTEADLEALVTAAHAHGIRILMDFVINHVHEQHEHFIAHPEWFRTGCTCGEANCDWTEHRLDCLFQPYMPDVNWEIPEAGEAIIGDALWWLERFDLDGLRVDAVKHVEDAAIFNLSTRVHETFEQGGTEYFLLGETAMGWSGGDVNDNLDQYATISRYMGPRGLNGQFDFVLYHAVSYNTFAHFSQGLIHADYWLKASLDQYPSDAIMTPYVGSHDTQRFLSLADPAAAAVVYNKWPSDGLPAQPGDALPYERSLVAFAWVLTLPGLPLLYYGDEYGEYGGSDPDNRHFWRPANQRTAAENALHAQIAAIGTARRNSEAIRRGDYTTVHVEENFLCFARHTATDVALVVLNRSNQPETRTLTLPGTLPQPTTSFYDALRPADPPVPISLSAVDVTVPARSAVILLPHTP